MAFAKWFFVFSLPALWATAAVGQTETTWPNPYSGLRFRLFNDVEITRREDGKRAEFEGKIGGGNYPVDLFFGGDIYPSPPSEGTDFQIGVRFPYEVSLFRTSDQFFSFPAGRGDLSGDRSEVFGTVSYLSFSITPFFRWRLGRGRDVWFELGYGQGRALFTFEGAARFDSEENIIPVKVPPSISKSRVETVFLQWLFGKGSVGLKTAGEDKPSTSVGFRIEGISFEVDDPDEPFSLTLSQWSLAMFLVYLL